MRPVEPPICAVVVLSWIFFSSACRKTPAAGAVRLEPAYADPSRRLPRELGEPALGLGLTTAEAKIRLPDLHPAESIVFAAPPTYAVCEEIGRTHDYLLAQSGQAEAFQSRPRLGGLSSLTLFVINNMVLAARGLYDETAKRVSYAEFIRRAAAHYGPPARAEALSLSDGTRVMYTVWQDSRTMIVLGETDAPAPSVVRSRYVYFIDGGLLTQSFAAARGHGRNLLDRLTF